MTETTETPPSLKNSLDICDRCPSLAVTRVRTKSLGLEIHLCGHHFRTLKPQLDAAGHTYYLTEQIRRDVLWELPRDYLIESDMN